MRIRDRRLLTAAITFGLAVGTPFVVNRFSVRPGAAVIKWLFELNTVVKPPADLAALAAKVSVTRNVSVPVACAPTALLDVYEPVVRGTSPVPVIMWIHGGGFVSSSKEGVADYAILLAGHGYVVASLDYTLAPQARYPVPVRQANAGLRYLAANADRYGGDPTRIFVGGDSAGAQIASQTAALATNPTLAASMRIAPGLPATSLRGALLFCGLYDLRSAILRTFMRAYLGHRDWANTPNLCQLSTTEQVTADYPPTLLTVGDTDGFELQGRQFVDALRHAGVAVRSQFYSGAGLGHEYQFNFTYPQTNKFFQTTPEFLAERSNQREGARHDG